MAHACTRRTRFPAFARPSASTRPESTRERKPVQLLQRLPETGYVLIRPRIPLWVCRTRRQGRRILHGLEALPAAKTACHPVVLMMKGFTAATKRTAPGSATQGRAGRTDEAAQGSADGTGGSTRQSGRNGRSGVSAADSGDNGANSRVMVAYGNAPDRPGMGIEAPQDFCRVPPGALRPHAASLHFWYRPGYRPPPLTDLSHENSGSSQASR